MFTVIVRVKFLAIEEHTKRFDELCLDVREAADVASDYWLRDGSDGQLNLLEARIIGYQWRINLLLNHLSESTWYLRDRCEHELDMFIDGLTGGDFQVSNRNADHDRAITTQMAAAKFITMMRTQRRRILNWQVQ